MAREAPLTPRDMTPRAAEGVFGVRNTTQGHGKSMGLESDLDPPTLAVCTWAMHMTSLSLGFRMPMEEQHQPEGLGRGVRERR